MMIVKLKDLTSLAILHVDVSFLQAQEGYFVYANELLAGRTMRAGYETAKLRAIR
jgi:hypothetical protein